MALHKAGRMFEERDHVHTLLYRYRLASSRRDHRRRCRPSWPSTTRTAGFVAVFTDRADGVDRRPAAGVAAQRAPAGAAAGTDAALVVGASSPLPLLDRRPRRRAPQRSRDQRTLLLWFLDAHPSTSWEPVILEHERKLAESGLGTVIAALPFIPTIPGTDTYTDQLWG